MGITINMALLTELSATMPERKTHFAKWKNSSPRANKLGYGSAEFQVGW
jgi:hypothetical protein